MGGTGLVSISGPAPGPSNDGLGSTDLRWWRRQVVGYADNLRDLPWRRTRQPWPVLVSEVMLQQTQAARVVDPWRRFLARFPGPQQCSDATVGAVVQAWEGLGYNRRAVMLHRAAGAVVLGHDGRVPASLQDLLALPGIGSYTARAVLAFAYEQDVAVVDTNVRRVVSRAVCGRPVASTAMQVLADGLLAPGRSWQYNQALVELGAQVCTRRAPRCDRCPLVRRCRWREEGFAAPDPATTGSVQSRFVGSDRQGRGRLVAALRIGPVTQDQLAQVMGWQGDPSRARRVAATVAADGLAEVTSLGIWRLPRRGGAGCDLRPVDGDPARRRGPRG